MNIGRRGGGVNIGTTPAGKQQRPLELGGSHLAKPEQGHRGARL
jgi:hypothetical protein